MRAEPLASGHSVGTEEQEGRAGGGAEVLGVETFVLCRKPSYDKHEAIPNPLPHHEPFTLTTGSSSTINTRPSSARRVVESA